MFTVFIELFYQSGSYAYLLILIYTICYFYMFILQSFKFTTAGLAKVVAPGLSISGLLEFTPEEEEEVKDCLLIHVEDVETIEVPLLG